MKKLVIPFLLSLKKGTFKPTRVFTGVDELEDLTFELKPVNKTADEIMQGPKDTDELKFIVSSDSEIISSTSFTMPEVFTVKIEFEWQKHKYMITFK